MAEPYKLTAEGLEEYKHEYHHLIDVEREQNKIALQEARALGDLSENSDYDFAKSEQARIETRIKQIEEIIKNHTIISGEKIEIEFLETGQVKVFQIVGVLETDPANGKISTETPIAKAIKGKKAGDMLTYKGGNGKEIQIKIKGYV